MNIIRKVLLSQLLNAFQVGHNHNEKSRLEVREGSKMPNNRPNRRCRFRVTYRLMEILSLPKCDAKVVINRCHKRQCGDLAR